MQYTLIDECVGGWRSWNRTTHSCTRASNRCSGESFGSDAIVSVQQSCRTSQSGHCVRTADCSSRCSSRNWQKGNGPSSYSSTKARSTAGRADISWSAGHSWRVQDNWRESAITVSCLRQWTDGCEENADLRQQRANAALIASGQVIIDINVGHSVNITRVLGGGSNERMNELMNE